MAQILFLAWNSFANEHMKRAWEAHGDCVTCFSFPREEKNTRFDEGLTKEIAMALLEKPYDYMFSFNYFPVAAMAAKACRVRYVAWVYDNPYAQLYSETIHYPTNDIRLFDRRETEKLRRMGVQTVSYLPMAADVAYYDTVTRSKQASSYQADISFVGSLYLEENKQKYRDLAGLGEYDKGYLEGILQAQKLLYGQQILEEMLELNETLLEHMRQVSPLAPRPDAFATDAWYYANFYLYRQVSAMERSEVLTMLAQKHEVKVYTHTQDRHIRELAGQAQDNLKFYPPVDYYTQAPLVYHNSKINLNITLRSMGSAIALRAFDIMGSGGFLLTNYQEDFLEYFRPDEDFVYYTDYEDLAQKVDFYLRQDAIREKIAQNGYEAVKKAHTYEHRLLEL